MTKPQPTWHIARSDRLGSVELLGDRELLNYAISINRANDVVRAIGTRISVASDIVALQRLQKQIGDAIEARVVTILIAGRDVTGAPCR